MPTDRTHTLVIEVPDTCDHMTNEQLAEAIQGLLRKLDIDVAEHHFEKITADLDEDYEPTEVDLDFPVLESTTTIKDGKVIDSAFATPTVPCPYCGRPVKRTVKPHEIKMCGEHCDDCYLPFGIDEHGNAYDQDDPRWSA